jgi:hypothetical protein
MTNDELERIERNMEFVVEHQAKFEADITRTKSAPPSASIPSLISSSGI